MVQDGQDDLVHVLSEAVVYLLLFLQSVHKLQRERKREREIERKKERDKVSSRYIDPPPLLLLSCTQFLHTPTHHITQCLSALQAQSSSQ